MKKWYVVLIGFCVLLFLSGCWDQELLKNARLLSIAGFDKASENKLFSTYVFHDQPMSESQEPKDEIKSAIGRTPRETRDKVDRKLSNYFRAYKNRVVMIGEELAKKDIYPILDIFYRDPHSSLNAKIVVAQGKASDLLAMKKVGNTLISDEIPKLIDGSEEKTLVTAENIQSICPVLFDPGEDILLPYLTKKETDIECAQLAMFHNRIFTGVLNPNESTMFLLLKGSPGKIARMTREEIDSDNSSPITFDVEKAKHDMQVRVQPKGKIVVTLHADWKIGITEYAQNHLNEQKIVDRLNRKISEDMTRLARQTIKKMQEAQCDGFGIGRRIIAFHPQVWKKMKGNWAYHYKKVQFKADVKVKIIHSGVIN
ncbi:Ger(x)C family spore germination protein [Shimazuella kribbensis]|uniref:Ger(x)C family spore germination protein n=1 Tax=Shimazuella kribbensis TaxID=139808 RepID=UPI000408E308|nr:Ger(x)C family spore germination protein [Shimazuella kribbensis]